jgi:hypothetical protein
MKRIKHAKGKTLGGQAFFSLGGVSSPSNCKRHSCVLKKLSANWSGEYRHRGGAIKTRKILLRVAVHALAFCNHSRGASCKLQPAPRLSGSKNQSPSRLKAGIALAMEF